MKNRILRHVLCSLPILLAASAWAADWPQWGGTPVRNNVSLEKKVPSEWDVGQFDDKTGQWLQESAKNVRWVAQLGSQTYGTPTVAGGRVFCATNNRAGWTKRYPTTVDLGCLVCFKQADGRFDWQLSCKKLEQGSALDWPETGICCSPLVEGNRVWLVTNRCEVVCLDAAGFSDRKNDGSHQSDPNADRDQANIVWSFDMIRQLGVQPHNMSSCSVTAAGDLLFVNTSNGADENHVKVPAPDAPSFIALDRNTGKLVWADNSPGANILNGQWSSPAYGVIGGVPQVVFAGGDGWLYSFLAKPTPGKPELLWKFDCNPKTSVWKLDGRGDRASIVATPVIHEDRVFIATGDDPALGEGPGHLWCIDATKRGDVSPELVFDKSGKPVAPRRLQAADTKAGDVVRPNPNSAAVWHYTGSDGKSLMHRTLSMAAIHDNLLVIGDLIGLLHCLDVKTGKPYWIYDVMSSTWGSPLIADGKIYIGNEDGEVVVLELSPKLNELGKNNVGGGVYTTPVAANGMLYIATKNRLIAIGPGK